jgi:hypothetical protein
MHSSVGVGTSSKGGPNLRRPQLSGSPHEHEKMSCEVRGVIGFWLIISNGRGRQIPKYNEDEPD